MTEVKFTDDDIRKLYNKGMNDRQIAEELNSQQWIIQKKRNKLGLKPNRNRKYMRKFTDQQLIELHSFGLSDEEIGKKVGVAGPTIGVRRRNLNLQPNQKKYRKFTNEQLIELHGQGLNDREISKKLGKHVSTIRYRRYKLRLEANQKNEPKFTDQQLLDKMEQKLSGTEIAELFDCSLVAIYSRKRKLGLPIKRHLKDQDLLDAYNSGIFGTDKELATYLGYTDVTIRNRRHKLGLKPKGISKRLGHYIPPRDLTEYEKMMLEKLRNEIKMSRKKILQYKTVVQVSVSTRNELNKLRGEDESYSDIIQRLINEKTR